MSYSTNNPYEKEFGYVRATRRGDCIYVSGTTSVDPEPPHAIRAPGDARNQTRIAFEESLKAIEALGGSRSDIYRVRMFVAEDKHCNDVGIAMREFFADQGGKVMPYYVFEPPE